MTLTTISIYLNTQVFATVDNEAPNVVDPISDVVIDETAALTWRRFGQDIPNSGFVHLFTYRTDEPMENVRSSLLNEIIKRIPDVTRAALSRAVFRLLEQIDIARSAGSDWQFRHSPSYFVEVDRTQAQNGGPLASWERQLMNYSTSPA